MVSTPVSSVSSRLLIFGFERFDVLKSNPSVVAGKELFRELKNSRKAKFVSLPTVYHSSNKHPGSFDRLKQEITRFNPDLIVGFGASSRPRVSIESIALNRVDNPKPDNAGKIVRHKPICPSSPLALETSFNVKGLSRFLKKKGIPSHISYFADTFICNAVYFQCLDYIQKNKLETNCVFIHVPLSPKEINALDANLPSFSPKIVGKTVAEFLKNKKE